MAQTGSTQSTLTIDVLHHWLAATVIPKPLTTAIPATHMPSPLKKLASLGTLRSTRPSPPANHAHPARTRRRDAVRAIAASIVSCSSLVETALMQEQKTHGWPISWAPGSILRVLLLRVGRHAHGRVAPSQN